MKTHKFLIALVIAVLCASVVLALSVSISGSPTKSVSTNGARIEWNTDIAATSRVDYGTTPALGSHTEDLNFVTFHRIDLKDLQTNVKYYYTMTSIDQSGYFVTEDNDGVPYTFTTNAGADSGAPVFSAFKPSGFGDTTTTFSWTTHEPATSEITFGKDTFTTVKDDALVLEHVMVVPTSSGQLYTAYPGGCDAAENCGEGSKVMVLAGSQNGVPPLTADVPAVISTNKLTIRGTTRPFATIEVFLDNVKRHTITASGDGTFVIPNLLLTAENSTVKLAVTDISGNKVEQSYPVRIDNDPPKVTLNPIPDIASGTPLTISGTADEPVTITYEVKKSFDTDEPDRVAGVKTTSVKSNTIELAWTASAEDDVENYAIYRDNVRIATSPNSEYEDAVSSGATYSYRVSAVDKSCNEGALSDSIIVKASSGGNTFEGAPSEVALPCLSEKRTLQASGQFSFSVDLEDGANQYKISIADAAGNAEEFEGTVRLDNTNPHFIDTNLDRLSPTYIPEVTIEGKVSEPATVFVYLNDESTPHAYDATDEEGNFKIKVKLKLGSASKTNNDITGGVILDASIGTSINKVRLEAVDLAGLKATQGPVEIKYALCGEGGAFDVDIGEISPQILTPRLIIEGVQQVGFPVNFSYRGAYKAIIKRVSLSPVELSLESEEDFDTGWVQYQYLKSRNINEGYVQLQFNAQPPEEDQSTAKKEEELFEHRKGDCAGPTGCARFLYQLNIEYQEDRPNVASSFADEQTTGATSPSNQRQKVCIPIEVHMDKPINIGDKVPKKLYEKTSQYMGDAIDIIDKILKPLTVIGEYTIYSCFALTATEYVLEVYEIVQCDVSSLLGFLGGAGEEKFKPEVARIGKCKEWYPNENSEAYDECEDCQTAVRDKLDVKDAMREVCDRVGCPAAPTLQTYIRDADEPKPAIKSKTNEQYYSGSSCGFKGKEATKYKETDIKDEPTLVAETETTRTTTTVDAYSTAVTTDYAGIKQQYINYLKHKDDDDDDEAVAGEVNCEGPHPANAECCGFEYNEEWNSACGLPGIGVEFKVAGHSIIGMDEIEQSACLAAQRTNQVPAFENDAAVKEAGGNPSCGGLSLAYRGLCDPETLTAEPEFFQTNAHYREDVIGLQDKNNVLQGGRVIIIVEGEPKNDPKEYSISSGYATQQLAATGDTSTRGAKDKKPITQTTDFIYENGKGDLTDFFKNVPPENQRATVIQNFAKKLCNSKVTDPQTCTGAKVTELYNSIAKYIEIPEKEYIVQPVDEGIFRSIQCVCLPAITGYLQHWRAVLGSIKTCVDHVRITGQGSSGACNELYSKLICDMLADVLRCFVKGLGSKGSGSDAGRSGVLDVIGILTEAGENTQKGVQDRYGKTALYQNMFSEGNLVHGVCMFAFTGEWDLNVGGLFEKTVTSIPLDSTGFVYPAERRYVSYNPSTSPKGLTTWLYHIGVQFVSGADVDYRLYLKCSNSRTCEERDGYKGGLGRPPGACDCYGQTELTLDVTDDQLGSGRIGKNDNLGADIYFTVQAESGVSAVRYDKVVFEYSYKDAQGNTPNPLPKVEAEIHLTGSDAPNFCSLKLLGNPIFSCTFGGDYVGAVFKGNPTVDSAPILLGQTPTFTALVDLFGTSDPRETGGVFSGANTKYLVYEVKNPAGTIVATNKATTAYGEYQPVPITTSGEAPYNIQMPKIEESHFGGTAGASVADGISYWDKNFPSGADERVYGDPRIDPGSSATKVEGATSTVDLIFVFNGATVDVYRPGLGKSTLKDGKPIPQPTGSNDGDWGHWRKGKLVESDTVVKTLGTAVLIGNTLTFTDDSLSKGKITITFLNPASLPPAGAEIFFRYQPDGGASGACANAAITPQEWKVNFKLFDAMKTQFGATYVPNFQQPTMDAQGNIQEKTITVQAVCSKSYAGAAGYPAGVKVCDLTGKANMAECFCGTKAEAAAQCIPGTICYNCGPGNTINADKNYCNPDAEPATKYTCDEKFIAPKTTETTSSPTTSTLFAYAVVVDVPPFFDEIQEIKRGGTLHLDVGTEYDFTLNATAEKPTDVSLTFVDADLGGSVEDKGAIKIGTKVLTPMLGSGGFGDVISFTHPGGYLGTVTLTDKANPDVIDVFTFTVDVI